MHGFTCYHDKASFIAISSSTRWKHSQCGCIYHITLTMYMNNDDLHTTVTSTCFLINQDSSDATLLPSKHQTPNSFDPHQQPYLHHSNLSHEIFTASFSITVQYTSKILTQVSCILWIMQSPAMLPVVGMIMMFLSALKIYQIFQRVCILIYHILPRHTYLC